MLLRYIFVNEGFIKGVCPDVHSNAACWIKFFCSIKSTPLTEVVLAIKFFWFEKPSLLAEPSFQSTSSLSNIVFVLSLHCLLKVVCFFSKSYLAFNVGFFQMNVSLFNRNCIKGLLVQSTSFFWIQVFSFIQSSSGKSESGLESKFCSYSNPFISFLDRNLLYLHQRRIWNRSLLSVIEVLFVHRHRSTGRTGWLAHVEVVEEIWVECIFCSIYLNIPDTGFGEIVAVWKS